jgi:hypothetical protein
MWIVKIERNGHLSYSRKAGIHNHPTTTPSAVVSPARVHPFILGMTDDISSQKLTRKLSCRAKCANLYNENYPRASQHRNEPKETVAELPKKRSFTKQNLVLIRPRRVRDLVCTLTSEIIDVFKLAIICSLRVLCSQFSNID